ncbi:MAG: protein phosphatase CheZ [Phyllobacteriaceae bacterium]|nr:protein phosphatase CheZ [Phyllobacteriaceae bacterium]
MAPVQPEQLAEIVSFLRRERGDLSLDDVMTLAERMAETLDETVARVDTLLHDEFRSIVDEIAVLRREIGAFRPGHMRFERIPEAGRELDAVVEATETATNAIMAAAETIMAADASDPDAYKALVDEQMMAVFEACSFQDITGQRIRKVVRTLSWIEDRLAKLAETLKIGEDAQSPEAETEDERRMRELILHGPQHTGEGVSQDFVDDVFSSNDQDDIDALFR